MALQAAGGDAALAFPTPLGTEVTCTSSPACIARHKNTYEALFSELKEQSRLGWKRIGGPFVTAR